MVLTRAKMANAYRGVSIGGIDISHLLYVDDLVLMATWDQKNVMQIVCILCCFFFTSSLKINLVKSKLYGVGVTAHQVSSMDLCIGCALGILPFFNLGVRIG